MARQSRSHRRSPLLPATILPSDPKRTPTPTEVIAVPDEVRCGVVDLDVLGEAISLAMLPGVLVPIRPVVPLDERRVDGGAGPRSLQVGPQQEHRAEDQRPHHLHHTPLRARLADRGVAEVGREDPLGLRWPPRSRPLRPRSLDAVDLFDGRLIGGMLVAGDQQVRPPRCPVVDLLDQVLAGVTIPLARHESQQQSALGIDGGVVPVVTTQPVQRVERIARLLLLRDEGPFLIELDLPGRGGKRPPVLGGEARHGRRPGRRSV